MTLVIISISVTLSAALIFPRLFILAHKIELVDSPQSKRKIHKSPTPLIGGILIGISLLIGIAISNNFYFFLDTESTVVIIAFFVLLIIGTLDDKFEVSAKIRLIIQIILAWIVVANGVYFPFLNLLTGSINPLWLNKILCVLIIVCLTNAYNLIDGIDGLSGSQLLLAFLIIWYLSFGENNSFIFNATSLSMGPLILFLNKNLKGTGKKIFMGDAGTVSLGFLIACMYIIKMKETPVIGVELNAHQVLMSSVFILPVFDTISVFAKRVNKFKSPFKADNLHLHHLLLIFFKSHISTTLVILTLSIFYISITVAFFHIFNSRMVVFITLTLVTLIDFIIRKGLAFKNSKKIILELEGG